MKKKRALVRLPDLERDRKLLRNELKKYLGELKDGTIAIEGVSPSDARFQSLFVNYHAEVLGGLVKLARILTEAKSR